MYLKWHFAFSLLNGFWKTIFILHLKWNHVYHLTIYKTDKKGFFYFSYKFSLELLTQEESNPMIG